MILRVPSIYLGVRFTFRALTVNLELINISRNNFLFGKSNTLYEKKNLVPAFSPDNASSYSPSTSKLDLTYGNTKVTKSPVLGNTSFLNDTYSLSSDKV